MNKKQKSRCREQPIWRELVTVAGSVQMERLRGGEKFPFAEHYWRDVSEDARDLVRWHQRMFVNLTAIDLGGRPT